MLKYKIDEEYMTIIETIMNNKEFRNLKNIKHHNTNRLDHSIKVSFYSYKIAKVLKLSYEEVARGGLLHDFYIDEVRECKNVKDKLLLFTTKHPKDAVENSNKYFFLSNKEIDIIKTHMFPVDYRVPKYVESWLVSIVDKGLSFFEFYKKFSYKLGYAFNLYLIFLFNYIR